MAFIVNIYYLIQKIQQKLIILLVYSPTPCYNLFYRTFYIGTLSWPRKCSIKLIFIINLINFIIAIFATKDTTCSHDVVCFRNYEIDSTREAMRYNLYYGHLGYKELIV